MRRTDREITNFEEIKSIMDKCDVCRIALYDEKYPYIVPLNFGYTDTEHGIELYFHGAKTGKKLSLIQENNMASFEMDCGHKLITADHACAYTMEFESVMGYGKIIILEGDERIKALNMLMKQYTGKDSHDFEEREVNAVCIFKLVVDEIYGKRLKK